MSCRVKLFPKKKRDVFEAVKNYNTVFKSQRKKLNESLKNDSRFVLRNGNLTDISERVDWPDGLVALKYRPKIILLETSVYDQKTQDSAETLEVVLKEAGLTPDNVIASAHHDEQKIWDAIGFAFPFNMNKDEINKKAEIIDKIMTSCGYFLSINPSYKQTEKGIEYIIQYEPNQPEISKITLPPYLHHLTTVANSNEIIEKGFQPKTNDIFKYIGRIYFSEKIDIFSIRHIVRRHKDEVMIQGKRDEFECVDVVIETPEDIVFYYDPHMTYNTVDENNSFFCTSPISQKYIKQLVYYKGDVKNGFIKFQPDKTEKL